ncbi:MAG TPA: DNA mismatch repair endonuclease MutL [Thermodesulfobacteriota bacterium]
MHPRIIRLPDAVVATIAAGEVVERPAAVVKEAIENALDAHAGRIDVAIEEGGRRLVEVADDGHGMTPEEARLALERHTTSKVRALADLLAIETYGFRGEALAAIAAVSRLTLVTREREALAGTRLVVEAGRPVAEEPAGAPPGTTVAVRDLFFNLPARRQFLRSPPTETAQVAEVVARFALAHPEAAFSLTVDRRPTLSGRRGADLLERLAALIGPGVPPLVPVSRVEGALVATGYVSPPGVSRAGANSLYPFVNRRPIRDRALLRAVLAGSRHAYEPGRYPLGAIFLTIPPPLVDVNVHPAKAEVRFRDPAAVHGLVARAVEAALGNAGALPVRALAPDITGRRVRPPRLRVDAAAPQPRPPPPDGLFPPERERPSPEAVTSEAPEDAPPPRPARYAALRYLGQVRASYLVCEGEDGLVIIDQHAAHERLRFERLRAARAGREPAALRLPVPRTVTLRPDRAALVVERAPWLAALGLEVEPFGPAGTVRVTAVPAPLASLDPAPLLEDVAADLQGLAPAAPLAAALDRLLATLACRGAVTFGRALDPGEVRRLLADLDRFVVTGACPHGRPVSRVIDFAALERLFRRR